MMNIVDTKLASFHPRHIILRIINQTDVERSPPESKRASSILFMLDILLVAHILGI